MSHMAVFFSIVPTIIVYLIIRWQKTKKYIITFSIGVFISFLLYLPYLIYEIQNNFPNFHDMINLRNTVKPIIQPPQIWSILFFPTNEPNWNYGNGIAPIINHWFNGNPLLIFSFLFYIISIILGLSSFIILLKDYFRKRLEEEENLIFKETALIYILYIVLTIIIFMILNLGAARARYFYNIFPLTFIPFIYLIKKFKNKKLYKLLLIYAFLNPLAVYIQMFHIYENENKTGWNFMISHVEKIMEDAKDKSFDLSISTNDYYPYILLKTENKNFRIDTNSDIKYYLISSLNKEFDSSNMSLIYSNKQYLTFKEYKNIK